MSPALHKLSGETASGGTVRRLLLAASHASPALPALPVVASQSPSRVASVSIAVIAAVLGMIWFLQVGSFIGFFAMVLALFLASGVGNASTFQMVPGVMRYEVDRDAADLPPEPRRLQAEREAAAVIGFTSAIAAYGAFYIPRAYGTSIEATGSAEVALWLFLIFYITCAALTWWAYSGPSGILRDVERRRHLEPKPA